MSTRFLSEVVGRDSGASTEVRPIKQVAVSFHLFFFNPKSTVGLNQSVLYL